MRRFLIFLFLVAGAPAAADDRTNGLTQFSGALERLAGTVGPAVVQVDVYKRQCLSLARSARCGAAGKIYRC